MCEYQSALGVAETADLPEESQTAVVERRCRLKNILDEIVCELAKVYGPIDEGRIDEDKLVAVRELAKSLLETKNPEVPKQLPKEVKKVIDKDSILKAIEANKGNKSAAARSLGISRHSLYQKLKEFEGK